MKAFFRTLSCAGAFLGTLAMTQAADPYTLEKISVLQGESTVKSFPDGYLSFGRMGNYNDKPFGPLSAAGTRMTIDVPDLEVLNEPAVFADGSYFVIAREDYRPILGFHFNRNGTLRHEFRLPGSVDDIFSLYRFSGDRVAFLSRRWNGMRQSFTAKLHIYQDGRFEDSSFECDDHYFHPNNNLGFGPYEFGNGNIALPVSNHPPGSPYEPNSITIHFLQPGGSLTAKFSVPLDSDQSLPFCSSQILGQDTFAFSCSSGQLYFLSSDGRLKSTLSFPSSPESEYGWRLQTNKDRSLIFVHWRGAVLAYDETGRERLRVGDPDHPTHFKNELKNGDYLLQEGWHGHSVVSPSGQLRGRLAAPSESQLSRNLLGVTFEDKIIVWQGNTWDAPGAVSKIYVYSATLEKLAELDWAHGSAQPSFLGLQEAPYPDAETSFPVSSNFAGQEHRIVFLKLTR